MLYVNCELPTEPQEHFTLMTTVTKLEPSLQEAGQGPHRDGRTQNLFFCLRGLPRTLAQEVCRRLRHAVRRPPRRNGYPKIHKEGVPLRPIVSNIGVPTYKLSRHCATNRKVAGSIPDGVIEIFH